MGCCLSKKDPSSSTPSSPRTQQEKPPNDSIKSDNSTTQVENNKKIATSIEAEKKEDRKQEVVLVEEEKLAKKKEVFIIQHRKSNDKRPESKGASDSDGSLPCNTTDLSFPSTENGNKEISGGIGSNILPNSAMVRTSSCTKEEVDAILIQCGRLSRSSSGKGNASCENPSRSRKYSGSKRSHDFDVEMVGSEDVNRKGSELGVVLNCEEIDDDERQRRRQSRGSHRRRTPSRSRERDQQQQRSDSRERTTSSGSGRRVSRSPGRRSESPIISNGGNGSSNSSNAGGFGVGRPGKMVSVPATVSSLSMDKSNSGGGGDGGNAKKALVKRNVGEGGAAAGSRGTASPRSQSPARGSNLVGNGNGGKVVANENNNNQQQQSISRNSSRKAEHSPYRRAPLAEIDMNSSLPFQPLSNKPAKRQQKGSEIEEDVVMVKQPLNVVSQNKGVDTTSSAKVAAHGTHRRTSSRSGEGNETANINYCRVNEHQPEINGQLGEELKAAEYDAILTPVIVSGADSVRLPQTLMRSRSSRRSRDLDINADALLNPNASANYNSLLLQDIQNFHQNSNGNANTNATINTNTSPPFSLPQCLSKACSILEAVADLNSSTGSNLSSGFSNDRQKSPLAADLSNGKTGNFSFSSNQVSKRRLETNDPFVESEVDAGVDLMAPTLHKYVTVRKKGVDEEEQESSGSNSFVSSHQSNWVPSSSWEPNSADSTDCWTSRLTVSEPACRIDEETQRKVSKNRRDSSSEQHQQSGIARSKATHAKGGLQSIPSTAAASS